MTLINKIDNSNPYVSCIFREILGLVTIDKIKKNISCITIKTELEFD
jgi:hypothetical protein